MSLYSIIDVHTHAESEDDIQSRKRKQIQRVPPGSQSLPPSKISAGVYIQRELRLVFGITECFTFGCKFSTCVA